MSLKLDLYLNYLKNELFFCEIAISNINTIANDTKIDAKMLFYHSSVLFNSLANISKIINNNTNIETINRSNEIKKLLNIKNKKIDVLNNRQYRNSNEHYDERIDYVLKNIDDYSCIDFSIFTYLNAPNFNNFGRIYISSQRTFYFINANAQTESICITEIEKVINYIKKQLNNL